jgi:hypothetical protein
VDIIGDISIGKEFKEAMASSDDPENLSSEEKDKRESAQMEARQQARLARVTKLADHLVHKLCILTESSMDADTTRAFEQIIECEAEELKMESYGTELLHAIGYTYTLKAKQHLVTLDGSSIFGFGAGYWHSMVEKTHIASEVVSTFKSAIDLQKSFSQLSDANEKGKLTPEERAKLEEQAANRGLQALWKGSKLEVESVLREVCDTILTDTKVSRETLRKRALALKIVGQVYQRTKGEKANPTLSAAAAAAAAYHDP